MIFFANAMSDNLDILSTLEAMVRRMDAAWLVEDFMFEAFDRDFSSLGWKLRSASLAISPGERAALAAAGFIDPDPLNPTIVARTWLLLRALQSLPPDSHAAFIDACFRSGDNHERETLLRALAVLPSPERFMPTALEACRVAVQTTFEAIACENVYPAAHFGTDEFCAMVLKGLHLGIPVRRVHGLATRCDSRLKRVAAAFENELKAAGKSISPDIAYILDLKETAA